MYFNNTRLLYIVLIRKLNGHGYTLGHWKVKKNNKKSMTKINSEDKADNELESERKYLL